MRKSRGSSRQSGFTLIELLIVIAMIMVISAMAVPSLMRSIADMRLRGRAISVQGLFQTARMRAVRDNKMYYVRSEVLSSGETRVYIDINGNSQYDNGEPSVGVSSNSPLGAKANAPNKTTLYTDLGVSSSDFDNYKGGDTTIAMQFNSRGLPCQSSGLCIDNYGYVYYFEDSRSGVTGPGPVWAAVAVTKAGRMKTYVFSGDASTGTWQ